MNISNNINFKARKPEIRKADDIQRKAKAEFPMLSSTYVDSFYKTTGKYGRITQDRINLYNHLRQKILNLRDNAREVFSVDKYIPYVKKLDKVKEAHIGNCMESASAAVTALIANGYTNTSRCSLVLNADFINKKSGEIEYSGTTYLDHSFALTDMNTGKKNIVVDPWLGFTDSKEGAIARYKQMKTDRDIRSAIYDVANQYFVGKNEMPFDEIEHDYYIKTRIGIEECGDVKDKDIQNISDYAKEHFPNLILEK